MKYYIEKERKKNKKERKKERKNTLAMKGK